MTSPSCFSTPVPLHGGPDAAGVPVFDFSTNSNACGLCPEALYAVQSADATRYPDPAYTALREGLGAFHGVTPARIVLAASASEFIHRMTALAAQQGAVQVAVPPHSYGDYAQAAQVRGLDVVRGGGAAAGLQWACEPSSPLGRADPAVRTWQDGSTVAALRVLDCATREPSRDPISDLDVILAELAAYPVPDGQIPLLERPQLIALNKIDVPEGRDLADLVRPDLEARGYRVFEVSAVSRQGLRELGFALAELIDADRAVKAAEPVKPRIVLRPRAANALDFEIKVAPKLPKNAAQS